jgi:dipeptidyl aminopeptidase/acylaminoacyl peptidase
MGSLLRLSIAACGLLALLAISAPAQATFPGKNGKIAFVSNRDDPRICENEPDPDDRAHCYYHTEINTEIYTVNSDGTGETRLTGSARTDDVPAWSPDGSKIAFARHSEGFDPVHSPDVWEIFTMNADGSGQTNLTNTPGEEISEYGPAWSPDGRKIAFSRTGYSWLGPGGIYVMNSDGGEQTFLTAQSDYFFSPAWSPNGTRIAFVSLSAPCCPYVQSIWTVNPDGTDVTRLTDGPSDGFPDWSPDGTKIAFTRFAPSNGIFTMNADGSGQTRVTNPGYLNYDSAPDWQPIPGPKRSDYTNAAQFCKAEQAFWGDQFARRYAGGPNAYGKCVSRNK